LVYTLDWFVFELLKEWQWEMTKDLMYHKFALMKYKGSIKHLTRLGDNTTSQGTYGGARNKICFAPILNRISSTICWMKIKNYFCKVPHIRYVLHKKVV
jgi:hypothetical protein